jgi:group I intron endonuclease
MTKNTGYRTKQKDLKEKLREFGEIYLVTCVPNGKLYIGQALLLTGSDLRPYGTYKRWIAHIYEARTNKPTCRYLNNAINKYGPDAFIVEAILTCKIDDMTKYEDYFINKYNTLVPNGYNLRGAGRCGRASDETKRKMSESPAGIKHPQYGKPRTDEVKNKIKQTNINNAVRKDKDNSILPKYLKYVNWASETGYHIVSHPLCKQRKFVTSKVMSDTLLNAKKIEALEFLNNLNIQLTNQNNS